MNQLEKKSKSYFRDLFINLLDTDLQNQILYATEKDNDIRKTIETIIKDGPSNLKNNILDWKIKEVNGQRTIFYKGKNHIPDDQELQ